MLDTVGVFNMSIHRQHGALHQEITIGQWIADNWLSGHDAAALAIEMYKAGYTSDAVAAMYDFVAELNSGMDFYSENSYGLHLIEVHAMKGGRG